MLPSNLSSSWCLFSLPRPCLSPVPPPPSLSHLISVPSPSSILLSPSAPLFKKPAEHLHCLPPSPRARHTTHTNTQDLRVAAYVCAPRVGVGARLAVAVWESCCSRRRSLVVCLCVCAPVSLWCDVDSAPGVEPCSDPPSAGGSPDRHKGMWSEAGAVPLGAPLFSLPEMACPIMILGCKLENAADQEVSRQSGRNTQLPIFRKIPLSFGCCSGVIEERKGSECGGCARQSTWQ